MRNGLSVIISRREWSERKERMEKCSHLKNRFLDRFLTLVTNFLPLLTLHWEAYTYNICSHFQFCSTSYIIWRKVTFSLRNLRFFSCDLFRMFYGKRKGLLRGNIFCLFENFTEYGDRCINKLMFFFGLLIVSLNFE